MPERQAMMDIFLGSAGWSDATVRSLAGDASNRRYFRLSRQGTGDRAVLMDAPPERGEDVTPFIAVATHLSAIGLSPPRIYASDTAQGFLLLEDLGDDLFARVLSREPELETRLYEAATDLLVDLHGYRAPDTLATYAAPMMAGLSALAYDWYAAAVTGTDTGGARSKFIALFEPGLTDLSIGPTVLIQRDYHAENLLWLPDRTGVARVGLLDFQDAMKGHCAYDLVSLLQDARRDVPEQIETAMTDRYIAATGLNPDAFMAAYRWLGVQRNLRILGVFARLCIRDGKPGYIDLIPRVWAHLQNDLLHPSLAAVRAHLSASLPEPTPNILGRLKEKCATGQPQ